MKKLVYIFAALAAAFAVSCTKETPLETPKTDAPAEVGMKEVTITASVDQVTKTAYDADGKFSWTKGDQISVWCSDAKYHTLTATESGSKVVFSGLIPEDASLGWYAFFPADENHGADCVFSLPMYKDLSESGSADLPMAAQSVEGVYAFKHMTAAALLTFTNFPEEVVKAKITVVNDRLKFSGLFKSYITSEGAFEWEAKASDKATEENPNPTNIVPVEERTFSRIVPVAEKTAQFYLPYKGTLWWDYDSTVEVIGYDAEGNEFELLTGKRMNADEYSPKRGEIVPYAALELPTYVRTVDWTKVDWTSEKVVSYVNGEDATDDAKMKELKVLADKYFMYVRLTAAKETPFAADKFDYFFTDGEGDTQVWWGWETTGTKIYYKERQNELNSETGEITKMRYYPLVGDRLYVNDYKTEYTDTEVIWTIAFPRAYVDVYKSSTNKVYFSFLLWNTWDFYWAIPSRGNEMLEVTLP